MNHNTFINDNGYSNFSLFDKKRRTKQFGSATIVVLSSPVYLSFRDKANRLAEIRRQMIKSTSVSLNQTLQAQANQLERDLEQIKTQNASNVVNNVINAVPTQILEAVQQNPSITDEEVNKVIEQTPQGLNSQTMLSTQTTTPKTEVKSTTTTTKTIESQAKPSFDLKKLIVPAIVIGVIIYIIRK